MVRRRRHSKWTFALSIAIRVLYPSQPGGVCRRGRDGRRDENRRTVLGSSDCILRYIAIIMGRCDAPPTRNRVKNTEARLNRLNNNRQNLNANPHALAVSIYVYARSCINNSTSLSCFVQPKPPQHLTPQRTLTAEKDTHPP